MKYFRLSRYPLGLTMVSWSQKFHTALWHLTEVISFNSVIAAGCQGSNDQGINSPILLHVLTGITDETLNSKCHRKLSSSRNCHPGHIPRLDIWLPSMHSPDRQRLNENGNLCYTYCNGYRMQVGNIGFTSVPIEKQTPHSSTFCSVSGWTPRSNFKMVSSSSTGIPVLRV